MRRVFGKYLRCSDVIYWVVKRGLCGSNRRVFSFALMSKQFIVWFAFSSYLNDNNRLLTPNLIASAKMNFNQNLIKLKVTKFIPSISDFHSTLLSRALEIYFGRLTRECSYLAVILWAHVCQTTWSIKEQEEARSVQRIVLFYNLNIFKTQNLRRSRQRMLTSSFSECLRSFSMRWLHVCWLSMQKLLELNLVAKILGFLQEV